MKEKLLDFIFDAVASEAVKKYRQKRATKRYLKALIARFDDHGFSPQQGLRTTIEDYSPALLTESHKVKKDSALPNKDCIECKGGKRREVLNDVLKKWDRLVILGEPGSGKSTMLNYICYQQCLIARKKKWKGHVPVLLRVREWTEHHESLIEYLEKRFLDNLGIGKDALEASFFQDLWQDGKCLLLIDGLDEAGNQRQFVEEQIADICRKGKKGNRIVVSSRILGFRHNFHGFSNYEIESLEHKQILAIATQVLGDATKAKVFSESIDSSGDLYAFTGNPFFLIMVAKQYMLSNEELPETKIEIIDLVSDRLFQINNVNGLDRERFRFAANQLLTTIASWYLQEKRSLQFHWRDLDREILKISESFADNADEVCTFLKSLVTDRGLLWESSKGIFEFQHRTLHEYYCGKYAASQENPFQLLEKLLFHEDFSEIVRFTVAILSHDKRLKDKKKVNSFIASILETNPRFSEYLLQPEIYAGICIGEAGNSIEQKYVDQVLERISGIVLELRECDTILLIRAFLHLWSGKGWLDRFMEGIIKACKNDSDPVSRLILVELIGEIGPKEPKAMEFLRETYFDDPIVFVRSKAIEMLVKWRATEFLPVEDLLERLENEPEFINGLEMEDALGVSASENEEVFDKLVHLVKTTTIEEKDLIYDVFQARHIASEKTVQFLIGRIRIESDEFDIDSILQALYNHRKYLSITDFLRVARYVGRSMNPRGLMLLFGLYSFFFPTRVARHLEPIIIKKIASSGLFFNQLYFLGRNGWFQEELIDSIISNFQAQNPNRQRQAIKYLGSASKNSVAAQDFLKLYATNNPNDSLGIEAMGFAFRSEPNIEKRLQFLRSFMVHDAPIAIWIAALLLTAQSKSIEPEQVQQIVQLYPTFPDVLKAAVLKNVRFLPPSEEIKDFVFNILEELPSHEVLFEAVNALLFLCDDNDYPRLEETLLKILHEGKPEVYTNLEEWRMDDPSQGLLEINLPLHHTPSVVRDALWDIFWEEQYEDFENEMTRNLDQSGS